MPRKQETIGTARDSKNFDLCAKCGMGGNLLCCDTCPKAFHLHCAGLRKNSVPKGEWQCASCKAGSLGEQSHLELSCTGTELDPHALSTLLLYLELLCPVSQMRTIVQAVARFRARFRGETLDTWRYARVETSDLCYIRSSTLPGGVELALLELLLFISRVVGVRMLLCVLRAIKCGTEVPQGFRIRAPHLSNCAICTHRTVLRTFCFTCAAPCVTPSPLIGQLLVQGAGPCSKKLLKRVHKQRTHAAAAIACYRIPARQDVAVREQSLSPSPPPSPSPSPPQTAGASSACLPPITTIEMQQLRKDAIERGLHYYESCFNEPGVFEEYGGDILFLARNLLAASPPEAQPRTRALVDSLARRFMACNSHLAEDEGQTEMAAILTTIEGLYALKRMGYHMQVTRTAQSPNTHTSSGSGLASTVTETPNVAHISPSKDSAEKISETTSRPQRQCASRARRSKSDPFRFRIVLDEIKTALLNFDVTDVFGFNPAEDKVPTAPAEQCAHCGTQNPRGATRCENCHAFLHEKIDYGCLTDAIVWAYLFDELEMPVECISGGHRVTITFDDIAKFLPAVRCYRTIDELGHNMYKLQCYFITHFLYVMSDWGQHSLRRELFAEEFHFIIANFQQALRLSDPELVGEFIQCLQHFGVCASTDPKLWHLMEEGRAFLLDLELKNGSRGLWVALRASIYDRYHSSYCAAVGLMDSTKYDYLARKEQPPIPIPFRDPTATMAPSSTPSEEDASGKETLVLHEEHDKEEIEVAVVRAEATTTAKSRKRSAAAAAVAQQQGNAHDDDGDNEESDDDDDEQEGKQRPLRRQKLAGQRSRWQRRR